MDASLVLAYLPTVLSLKQQVQQEFLPIYANHKIAKWNPATTLFGIFEGINDVGNSYQNANSTSVRRKTLAEYASLVNQLYKAGGRNFLFLNVPPVNLSPLTKGQGQGNVTKEARDISAFNLGVESIARNLAQFKDTAVWLFNTNMLFSNVLMNPKSYPQTSGYKNVTDYCFAYENGTATTTQLNASCVYPVNEYFWLNSLHPTYPMHNLLAYEIAEMLQYYVPL